MPLPIADALVATGFYRLGIWDDEPADRELARYDSLDDIVATTGQAFLGLTVDCARCHHHKIDPVSQHPNHLGRRVRAPTHRRIRDRHRPRPQRLWVHHVDGRWRHQRRHQRGRDRRTRCFRGDRSLSREEPPRHRPAPTRPRPGQADLLLWWPGSEARRRRRRRVDAEDRVLSQCG
ncbi:MAG: DUF1549 domain-containing protein [Verrucomicrobia bacterium]|nr:DUF1549 domain-containing protein [Verrucomicrobiota bacterium]